MTRASRVAVLGSLSIFKATSADEDEDASDAEYTSANCPRPSLGDVVTVNRSFAPIFIPGLSMLDALSVKDRDDDGGASLAVMNESKKNLIDFGFFSKIGFRRRRVSAMDRVGRLNRRVSRLPPYRDRIGVRERTNARMKKFQMRGSL
jgi:hypothetical protein